MVNSLSDVADHPYMLLVRELTKQLDHCLRDVLVFVHKDVLEAVDQFGEWGPIAFERYGGLRDEVHEIDSPTLLEQSLV